MGLPFIRFYSDAVEIYIIILNINAKCKKVLKKAGKCYILAYRITTGGGLRNGI